MVVFKAKEWSFVNFYLRATFFGAVAVGCGTVFTAGTAFYRCPCHTTISQVLFIGCTQTTGVGRLLTSRALGGGFTGRGRKTDSVAAGPEAMYCAMPACRYALMGSSNCLFDT